MAGNLKAAQELTQVVVVGRDGTLRPLFQNAGFSQVNIIRHINQVRDVVNIGRCNLLIMENAAGVESPMPIIAEVRGGKLGHNPFLPIVVLLADQDKKTATEFILAGVDDVWAKPLSPQVLNSRMKRLAEGDFEYEVAVDYIGPKRPIRGEISNSSLVFVPNVVRLIAEGEDDITGLISASIDATDKLYKLQVAAACGRKVTKLVEPIGSAKDPEIDSKLEHLQTVITEFEASVADIKEDDLLRLAAVLVSSVGNLRRAPNSLGLELLQMLAQAVEFSFAANAEQNKKAADIVKLIEAQGG